MTALITGANGFLGSVLTRVLLERGAPVRCLVRPGSERARLDALGTRFGEDKLRLVTGSLASPAKAAEVLGDSDVVYHLAANLRGTAADMCLDTIVTSKNLLEAARARGRWPRFVLISSFSVYGVGEQPRGSVVDETTPLEARPFDRDLYAQTKLRQEKLFAEYRERYGFELVVLRPGVIYGPHGGAISSRVGLQLPGLFLELGGKNLLPLSFVDNCAEAIALAGTAPSAAGEIYNLHDDDLPTCHEYLREYEKSVKALRKLRVPYGLLVAGSFAMERYHRYSHGQLPAIFTPYKTASTWKGNRFDNGKIKKLGWRQSVPTPEAMRRTFEYFRNASAAH